MSACVDTCTATDEGKTCGAVDNTGRCAKTGRVKLNGGLAERATFKTPGGRGRKLAFIFGAASFCLLCADHTIDVVSRVYQPGLTTAKPSVDRLLCDVSSFLDHAEVGLTVEEVRATAAIQETTDRYEKNKRKCFAECVGGAAEDRRVATKMVLDTALTDHVRNRDDALPSTRLREKPPPESTHTGAQTDGEQAAPWEGHPLAILLRRVLERGSYLGALLRDDTQTYCLIHTQFRQILIADGDGIGLGKLWSTREAHAMLALQEMHPNTFTRRVNDTLHGLGRKGLGRLNHGPYPAAQRHCILGFASHESLQKFRPQQSGALLEPNAAVAKIFAQIVRARQKEGDSDRILAAVTIDYSAGGGEAAIRCVQHIVNGVEECRLVGAAAKPDGSASIITVEDAKRLADIATVGASTGFESVILHTGDTTLPGGFIAGLVPVNGETGELLEGLVRRWRALLIAEKIELIVLGADFGSSNRDAAKRLGEGAPTELPDIPVWETEHPPTYSEMLLPSWRYYPFLFIPDVPEHVFKHIIYSGYDYEFCFGPNPRDKVRWAHMIFKLLGARLVGEHWYCSKPGDISLSETRDASGTYVPLSTVLPHPRCVEFHRELRALLNTTHLSVRDPQATGPCLLLGKCAPLFEEIGESTAAAILYAALKLHGASVGRIDGKAASCSACLVAGEEAVASLEHLQSQTKGKGKDAGKRRPRGGFTCETIEAARLALNNQFLYVKFLLGVGNKDAGLASEWVSARHNEHFHSLAKKDGNKFLDVQQTLGMGERLQKASLLRASSLPLDVPTRRSSDRLYSTIGTAVRTADSFSEDSPSRWEGQAGDPLATVTRRAPPSSSTDTATPEQQAEQDAETKMMQDLAAQLTDRSQSKSNQTTWRNLIVGGGSGHVKASTRKSQLHMACNNPSILARPRQQLRAFTFEVEIVRVVGFNGGALFRRSQATDCYVRIAVSPSAATMTVMVEHPVLQIGAGGGGGGGLAAGHALAPLPASRTTVKTAALTIRFNDILGGGFWCNPDTGLTSSGVVEITVVALRRLTADPAPAPCELLVVTFTPCFADRANLERLFNVPALTPKISSSAVAPETEPSACARVLASTHALFTAAAPTEPFPSPTLMADAVPSDESPTLAGQLGFGWESRDRVALISEARGLGRTSSIVATAVARPGTAELRTFLEEHSAAFDGGAGGSTEIARLARESHALIAPPKELEEGAIVVVRLPANMRPGGATDTPFFSYKFTKPGDSENECVLVDVDDDEEEEEVDNAARLPPRSIVMEYGDLLVSPHSPGGSGIAWVSGEVALVKWPGATAYYPAVVIEMHMSVPCVQYKVRFEGDTDPTKTRLAAATDMVRDVLAADEEFEDDQEAAMDELISDVLETVTESDPGADAAADALEAGVSPNERGGAAAASSIDQQPAQQLGVPLEAAVELSEAQDGTSCVDPLPIEPPTGPFQTPRQLRKRAVRPQGDEAATAGSGTT